MTPSEVGPHKRAFPFIRLNEREPKSRARGVTEISGPYYTPMGRRHLQDILETMGVYDSADPEVFAWYVKNFGPEVNLFVDHSQIVQMECIRSGIRGTKSLWGRVLTYKRE